MRTLLLTLLMLFSCRAAAAPHATGYIHTPNFDAGAYETFSDAPLTGRYDLRQTPGGLPDVRDQGACGSCWAFATTAALEGTIAVKEGRKVHLSEQEILSCNPDHYSCDGGSFSHGMQVNPGQSFDSDFSYVARDASCKANLPVRERIYSWAMIGTPGKVPTTNQIKQAIFQNGPVAVTVTANDAMQSYHGGLFKGCDKGETNHMVVLVGWNDTDKIDGQTGYWIMRNSWGSKWGDKGYAYIPYGCSRIGEDASTVTYKNPARQPGATFEVK